MKKIEKIELRSAMYFADASAESEFLSKRQVAIENKINEIIDVLNSLQEDKKEVGDNRQDARTYLQELLDKWNKYEELDGMTADSFRNDIEMMLEYWDLRIKD